MEFIPSERAFYVDGQLNIGVNDFGNLDQASDTVREDVNLGHGSHDLNFGAEIVRPRNHPINDFTTNAAISSQNSLSKNKLSDFMLGGVTALLQGEGEFKDMVGTSWSPYVQGSQRVSWHITVHLGIWWNPPIPYAEASGRVVCYVAGGKSQRFPNAPVVMLFEGGES